jgi:trehalose 6-phosphate phosphatase
MDFRSAEGPQRYDALVAASSTAIIGLDFDGTLSPIVADPDAAFIHPDGPRTLIDLAAQVRAVAIVTGRPTRQVVELGRLDEVADALAGDARLVVLGQYGNERWDSTSRVFVSPEPPPGLASFRAELPTILAKCDAEGAWLEEKGLAIGVHTRRLADPQAAYLRLEPALADAAERHGLVLEPGRRALEIRAPGLDKGDAVRLLERELTPGALCFAGDDLGDVEAFVAVAALRDQGIPGLLVCSGSEEQEALSKVSDVVVDGPDGVVALLRQFTSDAVASR